MPVPTARLRGIPLGREVGAELRPDGPIRHWHSRRATGRPAHGVIAGHAGSGTSHAAAVVVAGLRAEGAHIAYADAGPGWSNLLLNDLADVRSEGPDGFLALLDAVELRARINFSALRSARAAQRPAPELDMAVLVIEGLDRILSADPARRRELCTRLTHLARTGPPNGIAIVATATSMLAVDFGGDTTLRAMLAADNALLMRTTDRANAEVLGHLVNPRTLPSGGGWAYLVQPGVEPDADPTTALIRVNFHRHDDDVFTRVRPAEPARVLQAPRPIAEVTDREFRDTTTELAEVAPVAAGWDRQTGVTAIRCSDGEWRWVWPQAGPPLTAREVARLLPSPPPPAAAPTGWARVRQGAWSLFGGAR
jgi:hypothetical protein